MYKLFLTLRYLTRKKIVIFPILVVWLCVMMMIIVTSIMGGFIDHVRQANRDLLGDIVVSNNSAAGWPFYDELAGELKQKFPEISALTPVVHAYGLINFPRYNATLPAQIIGVDPAERSKVSRFRETLFRQYQAPMNAAEDLAAEGLPKTGGELLKLAGAKYRALQPEYDQALQVARGPSEGNAPRDPRLEDAAHQTALRLDRAYRTAIIAEQLPAATTFSTQQQLIDALVPKSPSFDVPPEAHLRYLGPNGQDSTPKYGCIVGVQIGLFPRDKRGNVDRSHTPDFEKAILTVVPVGAKGSISLTNAYSERFVIVDDSYSGVIDVDTTYVYTDFSVAQNMAGMRSEAKVGEEGYFPPRCNELLIKLQPGVSKEELERVRDRIRTAVDDFANDHSALSTAFLDVQTWNEKQAKYLNAVENEKIMQIFILGLMSTVVLVVIFLIFYMIVRDKTRDIGIIKAVGGSEEGIISIFLAYGLFIGIVGGVLGVLCGVEFVTHTNQYHEWIYQTTGRTIWDRSVYLFDRIPDTVKPLEVSIYFAAALVAGVLGALIPAVVAGTQDPVKAVRYE